MHVHGRRHAVPARPHRRVRANAASVVAAGIRLWRRRRATRARASGTQRPRLRRGPRLRLERDPDAHVRHPDDRRAPRCGHRRPRHRPGRVPSRADEHHGVGELAVRGPELFLGYLDPALNDERSPATASSRPATSPASTTTARSRSADARRTSSSAAARTSAPRRSRICCYASARARGRGRRDARRGLGENGVRVRRPRRGREPDLPTLVEYLEEHRDREAEVPRARRARRRAAEDGDGKVQKFLLRDRIRALVQQEAGQRPVSR